RRSPCLGLCERGPAALLTVAGTTPRTFAAAPVDAVGVVGRLEAAAAGRPATPESIDDVAPSIPQRDDAGLRLLTRVGRVDPTSIDAYRTSGGYTALKEALRIGREATIQAVTDARLVGRGGAAFPTGRKWSA